MRFGRSSTTRRKKTNTQMGIKYKKFIEENLKIVDKNMNTVPFILNKPQQRIYNDMEGMDIVLKARQEGFSSLFNAMFLTDFILIQNSYSVIVCDIDDNARLMLERVKMFLDFYEEINNFKLKLRYKSKTELYYPYMNSRIHIGTARATEFGRSRTIKNLHLSEAAFYPNISQILAGAGQAVVDGGRIIIETTANGFNEVKDFWEQSKRDETGFKPHFFSADDFYDEEFLKKKEKQLGRLYTQEYPSTDIEAFVASGQCYFDTDTLKKYYDEALMPGKFVSEALV